MSAPVTETDSFPATVTAPGINDTNYPTIVPQMATQLASRTRYHENTLDAQQGDANTELVLADAPTGYLADMYVPVAGRADQIRNIGLRTQNLVNWVRNRVPGIGRVQSTLRWAAASVALNSTYWPFNPGTAAFSIKQAALSGTQPVILTVPQIEPGLVLRNLNLTVRSAVSHGGTLPNSMPIVHLLNQGAGTATTIAQAPDTSANTTVYEAVHDIVVTFEYTVTANDCFVLAVLGENGGTAQANSFEIFRASMGVWYA